MPANEHLTSPSRRPQATVAEVSRGVRRSTAQAPRRGVRVVVLLLALASVSLFAGTRERKADNALVTALNQRLSVVGEEELATHEADTSVSQYDLDVLRSRLYYLMENCYRVPDYDCATLPSGKLPPFCLVEAEDGGYTDDSLRFLEGNGGGGYLYTVLPSALSGTGSTTYARAVADGAVPILQVHIDELARAINGLRCTAKSASFTGYVIHSGGATEAGVADGDNYDERLLAAFRASYTAAVNSYIFRLGEPPDSSSPLPETRRKYLECHDGTHWLAEPTWWMAVRQSYLTVHGVSTSHPHQVSFYSYIRSPSTTETTTVFRPLGSGIVADQYNRIGSGITQDGDTVTTTELFPSTDLGLPSDPLAAGAATGWVASTAAAMRETHAWAWDEILSNPVDEVLGHPVEFLPAIC